MTTQSDKSRYAWGWLFIGLLGCTYTAVIVHAIVLPQWRANQCYVEGRCVLLDKSLVEERGAPKGSAPGLVDFLIRHTVDGRDYEAWTYDVVALLRETAVRCQNESDLAGFIVGKEYPCWYDPADPSQVVLVRGYNCYSYVFLATFVGLLCGSIVGLLRPQWSAGYAADAESGAESGSGRAEGGHSFTWGDLTRTIAQLLTLCGAVAVVYVILGWGGAKWPSSLLCSLGFGFGVYVFLLDPLLRMWIAPRRKPPDSGPPR
jgi:hypothetical protein